MNSAKQLTDAQTAKMSKIRFWHRIQVGVDIDGKAVYTPGEVRHGEDGGDWPTTRFGLPVDLSGKSVADIGAWDGFFSFEAEKRGAALVDAFDIPESEGGNWGGPDGFLFARAVLESNVSFRDANIDKADMFGADAYPQYDVTLCYGVLYHVENPVIVLRNLFAMTKPGGECLIETARDPDATLTGYAAWCLIPGKEGDPSNKWYPSLRGLKIALEYVGFTNFEIVFDMTSRCTVRVKRPALEVTGDAT